MTPKIVTAFREGYSRSDLRADMIAGLTVAIVALPLSMAIAIARASHRTGAVHCHRRRLPRLGLVRQPLTRSADRPVPSSCWWPPPWPGTGWTASFSPPRFRAVPRWRPAWFRLGTYVKFIPYPVTVGFTAGIAVIIFASQLKDLFGLTLSGKEPGEIIAKIETCRWPPGHSACRPSAWRLPPSVLIFGIKAVRPHWPNLLIAVGVVGIALGFRAAG